MVRRRVVAPDASTFVVASSHRLSAQTTSHTVPHVKRLSGNPWSFRLRSFCLISCRSSSSATSLLPFKNLVLLVFSLYFYAWGEGLYVLLMIASGLGNFAIARWIAANSGSRARAILAFGVALNLSGLFVFKYLGFCRVVE